jgi:hypothetical protein
MTRSEAISEAHPVFIGDSLPAPAFRPNLEKLHQPFRNMFAGTALPSAGSVCLWPYRLTAARNT